MSMVTDIILCSSIDDGAIYEGDHTNIDLVSQWLEDKYGPRCGLKRLNYIACGNKMMQADVFGTAVNYCNEDELLAVFRGCPWEYPESAQLFLKGEHADWFSVFTPRLQRKSLTPPIGKLYKEDAIVNHILRAGGSEEECIDALVAECKRLRERLIELESIAPKRYQDKHGRTLVVQIPAHLIPITHVDVQLPKEVVDA